MTDYYGYATLTLKNDFLSLDVLKDSGPRIVRLVPAGSGLNLLAEVPDMTWGIPGNLFHAFGGHRLWRAPELEEITCLPDHTSCAVEPIDNGLRLTHDDRGAVSYRRELEIVLDPAAPKLTLTHRITNLGTEVFRAAPWAITMFRLGGSIAHLPMSDAMIDGSPLTPNRSLVLWPYSRLEDERLFVSSNHVELRGEADDDALKVGVYSNRGWAAIEFAEGWVVVKRFAVSPAATYTDMGANVQCYVRHRFIELETLGEVKDLQPGEAVNHVEEWELLKGSLASLGLV
jgi:hypothetical protein